MILPTVDGFLAKQQQEEKVSFVPKGRASFVGSASCDRRMRSENGRTDKLRDLFVSKDLVSRANQKLISQRSLALFLLQMIEI